MRANIQGLLEDVTPECRETATWLTVDLLEESADPDWRDTVRANQVYRTYESKWLNLLRRGDVKPIAKRLQTANRNLRRLLRMSLLQEFDAEPAVAHVIVKLVSEYPELGSWCGDALLYRPLASAVGDLGLILVDDHWVRTEELESAAVTVAGVSEAVAVAAQDDIKGVMPEVYVALEPGVEASPEMAKQVSDAITNEVGQFARPRKVWLLPDLPKTRSGRIMRRVLSAISNNSSTDETRQVAALAMNVGRAHRRG